MLLERTDKSKGLSIRERRCVLLRREGHGIQFESRLVTVGAPRHVIACGDTPSGCQPNRVTRRHRLTVRSPCSVLNLLNGSIKRNHIRLGGSEHVVDFG